MNSQFDWILVVSESEKTFSLTDVAIFDINSVTVAMVTGRNTGLTPVARLYREFERRYYKLLCERDISILTPISKCGCQSQKLAYHIMSEVPI